MNKTKLLEGYSKIMDGFINYPVGAIAASIDDYNEYMVDNDTWEHEGDCDVVHFTQVGGAFCRKCGFIYPF